MGKKATKSTELLNQEKVNVSGYIPGKPPQYTDNIRSIVLKRIENGENPLTISKDKAMPVFACIYNWIANDDDFKLAYANFAHTKALETVDIADDEDIHPSNKVVQIKARQWLCSKLNPTAYGDSATLKHADADGGKLSFTKIIESLD